jgi:hypothetical protein
MMAKANRQFVLCVRNDGYPASLELHKVYRRLADRKAAAKSFVRIVDESGEDYLYPADFFVPIDLSQAARAAFAEAG